MHAIYESYVYLKLSKKKHKLHFKLFKKLNSWTFRSAVGCCIHGDATERFIGIKYTGIKYWEYYQI